MNIIRKNRIIRSIIERKEGYYWVKYDGKWEIVFYNIDEMKFERHMDDCYVSDEEFDEIDENIISRKTMHNIDNTLFNSIGEWSKKTFPDAGSIQHIIKLKNEAQEVIESPYDIKEYADCIIALLSAAYKADITFFELVKAVEDKLEINKKRNWTKLSDGTYQHN